MKIRPLILASVLALILGLAFAATVTENASAACYDASTKSKIPCPPSNEKQKKPTRTEVPPTETPAPTATLTPAPTASPTPAASATPAPAIVVPPAPAGSADNATCRTSPLGGLLAGVGLLAASIILRAAPGATDGSSDAFAYGRSQDQARVIGTAFGEGSVGANGRLGNAGPVSGSSGQTGAGSRAEGLVKASKLARLLSLPGMGIGGLLMVVAGGQYGGVLGCAGWPAPAAGGIAATGFGAGVAVLAVAVALIFAALSQGSNKYTLFLPDGTPTRSTVHLAMKQSRGASNKTESDSSSDDDSDGDDS